MSRLPREPGAKHVLLDGTGRALVGARLPWSDAATGALTALEGTGPTPLIGTGRATTPLAAALLNSSYVQGFELDDYHPIAPVHGASLVIPAMLSALPIATDATGADLLLGAIRGFEVGVGLAATQACGLMAALAAQFAPARVDADDVWALIECTTLRHEPKFDERFEDGYNTRVEVALNDGTRRTTFIEHPRGGLLKPLTNDEVVDKFRALTEPLIDSQRAQEIESMVLALEDLTDPNELVALLAPPVNPIFADPEVPA